MRDVYQRQKGTKKHRPKECCNNKYQSKTRYCQQYYEDKENFSYSNEAMLMTCQKGESYEFSARCMSFG